MPGILSDLTTEVYNSNDYVMKVWDSVTSELNSRTVMQNKLQSQRLDAAKQAAQAAEQANINYVQRIHAAWGDLIHTASTVPAVIEQNDETIRNDDNLQKTLAGDLVRTATDGTVNVVKEQLPIEEEKRKMANSCSKSNNNAPLVSDVIKNAKGTTASGLINSFRSGLNMMKPSDAAEMASIDCTKEVASAMMKDAGKNFASDMFSFVKAGALTPGVFAAGFDELLSNAGTVLGNYLGGALSGLPNGNLCASQVLTNLGAKCALAANLAESAFQYATFGGQIANNMINAASAFVVEAPNLLIHCAETLTQTAVNTAFLAIRTATKSNCLIKMAVDAADGMLGMADTVIEGGVAIINTAQELKSSVDTLISTTKNFDIMGETKRLFNNHPVVRSVDNLIKDTCVDIRTYMRLTQTGIKYARISLGADRQNKLSSVSIWHNKTIKDTWSREYVRRQNYTTDMHVNRYNAYGMFSFSYK